MERTTSAMIKEIRQSPIAGRPAKTIFFGGGTPTYLPVEQLNSILQAVLEVHPPVEGCEITSEANPGTVDSEKFEKMREAGFNRLSLGAQSFQNSDLIRLGRIHQASEVELAVTRARAAGFDNINVDLMFALPGQNLGRWRNNLETALDLGTDHLSLYCLTLEPNTPFYKQSLRGELVQPDEEDQLEMFDLCRSVCAEHGLFQYEISNYAKAGRQCEHNLCYWRAEEYAGYGPGAVGSVQLEGVPLRVRKTNLKHPDRYCEAVEEGRPLAYESEELTPEMLELERIMLGLRLNEGLSVEGLDPSRVQTVLAKEWVNEVAGRLVLTEVGQQLCNQVLAELV